MDQDIDSFVKEIHYSNNSRPHNINILIPFNMPQSFKSVIFELKDIQICRALPNVLVLQAINLAQLNVFISQERNDCKY